MRFTDFISIEMSGPFELTGRLHSARLCKVHKGIAHRISPDDSQRAIPCIGHLSFTTIGWIFFILLIVVPQNDTGFN